MRTMSEKRWWCNWYLSPSEENYLGEDEIFFFRLITLIPFFGMLISWPWWNNQTLFPDWFNKSLAIILFVVCFSLSLYRHRIVSPIHMLIIVLIGLTFFWHVLLFLLQPGPELKTICERIGTFENFLSYTLCKWSDPLWWALLRDGPYFIMVLYSTVSLQFPLLPSSLIAAPFDDRQLTPSPILNRRRQQRTRERRRSPFVIHYILLRTGHIRRRRR